MEPLQANYSSCLSLPDLLLWGIAALSCFYVLRLVRLAREGIRYALRGLLGSIAVFWQGLKD